MRRPLPRLLLALLTALAAAGCAPKAPPVPPVPAPSPSPTPTPARPPAIVFAPVQPLPVALCEHSVVHTDTEGRLFQHYRYPETPASALVPAQAELSPDGACLVQPAMLNDLGRLLAGAGADPAVAGRIRAVSCHRTIALQAQTFCGGIGTNGSANLRERAWASAPPGHSEHATGYVIDFGTRDANGCPDAEGCFGATAVGKWLFAHAAEYGFEMSFPAGNRQQVKWEPWHWRWVGTSPSAPGAQAARALFARARAGHPASPSPAQ